MAQIPTRLETVLDNGYNFQFGDYISRGFNIFGKNAGMFIGYLLVYMCISLGLGLIPILGQIGSLMISGALIAGYFIVADKVDRGENAEFSNFFDGFQSWSQLFVGTLILVAFALGIMIPFIFYFVFKFSFALFQNPDPSTFSGFGVLDFIAILALFAAILYLSVSFVYMPLFVVFDKMDAWSALMASRKVVEKTLLMHIVFFIVWGLIIMISALPLLLGLLVTLPAFYCSMYAAWADITNYQQEEEAQEDDLMRHLID